ncbi:MAG: glycosyltransferase [Planctomycetota bacterium]
MRSPPLPRSPEIEALPRPIVTYVGNLELRLDWEILEQVAATWQGTMALVGPPGERARARPAARLRAVARSGACAGVPAMLAASDVLILPHVVNAMTRGMDPQKLHEYLASGRPVVATPVQGTEAHAELVAIAAQPAAFVRAVHAQLESDSPALAAQRVAAALARTWQTVVPAMLDRVLAVVHAGARLKAERKRRYHSLSRPEVRALVPASAVRVLDVGCGTGALGAR